MLFQNQLDPITWRWLIGGKRDKWLGSPRIAEVCTPTVSSAAIFLRKFVRFYRIYLMKENEHQFTEKNANEKIAAESPVYMEDDFDDDTS